VIKIVADDIWDPRLWIEDDHEHRIYSDDTLATYCVVDAKLYPLLCRYKWSIHDRRKAARGHIYFRRVVTEFWGPEGEKYESRLSGKIVRNFSRWQYTRFLHQEVMLLSGIIPPSPEHKEVDHINRKLWDCRLENLRWATRLEQVANSRTFPNVLNSEIIKSVIRELSGDVQESGQD
jgi:hypothetical protein